MPDGKGIPVGCIIARVNRHDSALLRSTLECLFRFGYLLPEQIKVHLDAGYDSHKTRDPLTELGRDWEISTKGEPLLTRVRWVVERTNAWHNRGFKKLAICTERKAKAIEAMISLANSIRRLTREAWVTHRWASRAIRKLQEFTATYWRDSLVAFQQGQRSVPDKPLWGAFSSCVEHESAN